MKCLALFALILLAGCTTGTHRVTGSVRPAISPDQVIVYHSMPAHSRVIGIVTAQSFAGITEQDAKDGALEEVKAEAAKLGANGLVLENTNSQALDGAKLLAKAVFVSNP
jgi:hypothetical protein